jgi:hypothetical protein
MPYASITRTPNDRAGNAAMTEILGDRPSVEEAQLEAAGLAGLYGHGYESLHWKQFSPTTWGLMDGGRYTHILVTWIDHPHAVIDAQRERQQS